MTRREQLRQHASLRLIGADVEQLFDRGIDAEDTQGFIQQPDSGAQVLEHW